MLKTNCLGLMLEKMRINVGLIIEKEMVMIAK